MANNTVSGHSCSLDSTMKLTDAKGAIMGSYTYGVYGKLLSGDTGLTRFLYNGRCGVSTDDNGLYYMRQRYYNPEIKRFVNQDVLTGSIGNSQSLNRYSYVQGNPVSYTDPFGLSPLAGMFEGTALAHGILGVLGCIPGIGGAIFNAVDAWVYYYYDKDYFMATMSGISALSMGFGSVGKWAGKAASYGAKGSKATKAFQYLSVSSTMLSNGIEFGQNGYQAAIVGYSMWDKYVVNGEEIGWNTVGEGAGLALSLMGCAASGINMSKSGKQLGKMLKEDNVAGRIKQSFQKYTLNSYDSTKIIQVDGEVWACFVAGTKIKASDGSKCIEDIQVGDYVYAKNPDTGECGWKRVVRVFVHQKTELIHIQLGDERIDTTTEHPFWVDGYGFKAAEDLLPGEYVETADGELLQVISVEKEYLEEPVTVYNFEVEDWHTYYVSEEEVLVHNMCALVSGSNTKPIETEIDVLLSGRPELTGTNREKLLATVQDSKLYSIVDELYRPGAYTGDGGTASMLTSEFYAGGARHLEKATGRLSELNKLAKTNTLSLEDLDVLDALRIDLENAINLFE